MWIVITMLAVVFQLFRNAYSKKISNGLKPETVTLSRFLFGIPAVAAVLLIFMARGNAFHVVSGHYYLFAAGMGIFQLLANVLMIMLFKYRNFSISMTLIKTETIILAVLGIFFLQEGLGPWAWAGIILATAGLVTAAVGHEKLTREGIKKSLFSKASLMALGAGVSLAVCTVFLKKAYGFITAEKRIMPVLFSLVVILSLQSVILAVYISLKYKGEWGRLFRKPGLPLLVGILSAAGSFFWFTAFSMKTASYVRTVGQTEFILGILLTVFMFGEKIKKAEIAGMAGVAAGTVILLFQ